MNVSVIQRRETSMTNMEKMELVMMDQVAAEAASAIFSISSEVADAEAEAVTKERRKSSQLSIR
jgi:hypothetical protein